MILITGGSGFLADELILRLKGKMRILARNEGNLIKMKQKFPNVEIMTGDIADEFIVQRALEGVDTVYHLAAFKHVGLAEDQPYQCTISNLIGSMNLLAHFKKGKFMAISTDKAAQVAGVYGATKFLMERLIAEYAEVNKDVVYRVVRYGNVLYSTGSVIPKWRKAIESGGEIVLTSASATRFFWTVEQAVDHIFECWSNAKGAEPYCPKMKAMVMGDLLEAVMKKYGKADVKIIGMQAGENRHETIDGEIYSDMVPAYTVKEIMELI